MPRAAPRDEFHRFGLASWRGHPPTWTAFHRHDEVELNLIESGTLTYRFAHGRVVLRAGDFGVFWGAMAHQIIDVAPATVTHWLTVPLAEVLQWQLPANLTRRLLDGTLSCDRDAHDLDRFSRWHLDLASRDPQRRHIIVLEAEARLRRHALTIAGERRRPRETLGNVERMASYMVEHATEPLRVADIARVVGLNPDYAVTLFKKTCGMGLIDYLNLQRVAHAQRLLVTNDRSILDIAFASGFGSASRFYAVFAGLVGKTPRAFRAAMRPGQGGP